MKFGPGNPTLDRFPMMPQATNLKVKRDMELCPVGPGTVFNRVVQISSEIRNRAKLINKTEEERLQKVQRIIAKEHRFRANIQNKVIERTSKTLKEKQALLQVLAKDYKFDNFITMQRGFDSNEIETKDAARRYVMESRVFNCGFNMKALKPEVYRTIRKLDPNQKYREFKKRLLAENRERNVEINRAISKSAFRRMLHDREHWRDYNHPPEAKRTIAAIQDDATHVEPNEKDIGNIDEAQKDGETQIGVKTGGDETQDKETIIERRLPRQKMANFAMTMNTLGPVYFQASVNKYQREEVET